MARSFDPDRVAALETAGWKAYAARNWSRFVLTLTVVNGAEFHIPFPRSLLASWYITRAGVAWVPVNHDLSVVRAFMEKYYALVRMYSGWEFDPTRAAEYELWYWDVHRRLSERDGDKPEFVDALTAQHAEIFGISREAARESAQWRVEANNRYDRILLGTSPNNEETWAAVQLALQHCYRSIAAVLDGGSR